MHAKVNENKHRRVLFVGALAGILIVAILLAIVISSFVRNGKFDKYYEEGSEAYSSGDYSAAAVALEKALKYGESVDCYVLLANTYYSGLNDMDKAIETLYIGSYKYDSETIDTYLEELKDLKSDGRSESVQNAVTIGGETISKEVTSLVLSQQRLKNSDIAPLAELKNLQSLSLTDNGLTDIKILAGLTELNFLQLGNNQITDITPLAGLSKLRSLYIDGNPIDDYSPLYSLSWLTTLSLKNTGISDDSLEALQKALPNCKIHCDKSAQNEVVEITIGGETFKSDVTELDLRGKGITDISELVKCTNLTKLDLRDNKIKDLTPLMDLPELSWLCIWNNQVEDILPLMGLSKLTYLDADHNNITDITAVSAMTSMEELWLSFNDIDSIKPIAKLTVLKRLGLKGTGLSDSDINILKNISSLKELALEDNKDLSGEAVDGLKSKLADCTITHSDLVYTMMLAGVSFKSDAQSVSASGTGVSTIKGLDKFSQLKSLQLTNTSVSDLTPISGLEKLETLEIWSGESGLKGSVTDISPLNKINSLKIVNLMWNSITDISPLIASSGITELYLTGNSVSSLSPLSGMSSLRELTLDRCPVGSLAPISGLKSLNTLSLQSCSISDISAIKGLTRLHELYLDDNNISDLTALSGLTNLNYLYICNNNLTADQVRELQSMLPNCSIYTDLDLTIPQETVRAESTLEISATAG